MSVRIPSPVPVKGSGAVQHPVMIATAWRRRNATTLMRLSLAADSTAVALLLLVPTPVGPIFGASLIVLYSIAARRVSWLGADGCKCFWRFLGARSLRALMVRNAVLLAEALIAAVVRSAGPRLTGFVWMAPLLLAVAVGVQVAGEVQLVPPIKLSRAEGAFPGPHLAEGTRKEQRGD